MNRWFYNSFLRALLLAMLAVSLLPILTLTYLFADGTTIALNRQMETNLQKLVASQAAVIDLQLEQILQDTEIAADQARLQLQREPTAAELAAVQERYHPDSRNILGLDRYYQEQGGEVVMGTELSNVYWDNDQPLTDSAARAIAQSSALDPLFRSIKVTSPSTQWIYLTTPEGMMRLYPWASNDNYPKGWRPTEVIFYTIAAPRNNPALEPRWTAPYVDFAGAGWMVTLSIPIQDDDGRLLGVMSHDMTINALRDLVNSMDVLDGAGYAFLIDGSGQVISHPEYQEDDSAQAGTISITSLEQEGSDSFHTPVAEMMAGHQGMGMYEAEAGERNIIVYAPIPTIGWSLGIVIPESEVVAPVTVMRRRTFLLAILACVVVALLALSITRALHRPLRHLQEGAQQLRESGYADPVKVDSFRELQELAHSFNEMAARVWQRENLLKARVRQLHIQIDSKQRQREVQSIVESDYFRHLELNAARLRSQLQLPSTSDDLSPR